ncbi:hypothetical protein HYW32_02935 [Candidatus Berkelbacteria bacterium]|nr:hypothetical protein [Candidatus Berkelbacteria bacterium]
MNQALKLGWISVLVWWYQIVPGLLVHHARLFFLMVIDYFSFGILASTLFEPWKRDEISTENLSLQDRIQVFGLNLITRFFGFLMRSAAITAGVIILLALALVACLVAVFWLMAPLLALILGVNGILTILGGER